MRRNIDRWRSLSSRLSRESTIWLATVRPSGRPHLAPLWFIWLDEKIYIATGSETRKYDNLRHNQSVALALPDPMQVIIIEGTAYFPDYRVTDQLAEHFYNKYEWDFRHDDTAGWKLVEITPRRILAWGDGYDQDGARVL